MDSLRQALDSLFSWLVLPATIYGAGGAMLRAARTGRSWRQIIFETVGGVTVANMLGPLISKHAPENWHASMYFLAGWGGLELVGWAYELTLRITARRIERRFGDGHWDGEERRKVERIEHE